MRIVHRISVNSIPEVQRELAAMRIFVGKGDPRVSRVVTFELDESNEAWPAVREWIVRRKALDIVYTKFSAAEIAEARWLELEAEWHHGYPQPNELDFGYRQATYDLTHYCERCGIGLKQKAPFQMRGEPKWGRKSILQLNWVFDEYFVRPEIWMNVFKPYAINCRPVTNTKGVELKSVVQLVLEEEVGIKTHGLSADKCPNCGRVKYRPVTRGMFPQLMDEPSSAMVRTREYFGSGALAFKGVLVSAAIASGLIAEKIRGASLMPVARR